jgi:hypothetical protein
MAYAHRRHRAGLPGRIPCRSTVPTAAFGVPGKHRRTRHHRGLSLALVLCLGMLAAGGYATAAGAVAVAGMFAP